MKKATYHRLPKGSPLIGANDGKDLVFLGWLDDRDTAAIEAAKGAKIRELSAPTAPAKKAPIRPGVAAAPAVTRDAAPREGSVKGAAPAWVQPDTDFRPIERPVPAGPDELGFVKSLEAGEAEGERLAAGEFRKGISGDDDFEPIELDLPAGFEIIDGRVVDRVDDIKRKVRKGEKLTSSDSVYVFENIDNFKETVASMPSWWQRRAKSFYEEGAEEAREKEAARAASRAVATVATSGKGMLPGRKGTLPFVSTRDIDLQQHAAEAMQGLDLPVETQLAAREGVTDVRKVRQESMRVAALRRPSIKELRGQERETAIDDFSRGLTMPDTVVPNASPPGFDGDNDQYVEDNLRRLRIGGMPLPEETITRTMLDYRVFKNEGAIKENGGAVAPWRFWSALWKGMGGSAGSEHATPIGELVDRHLQGHFERAERSKREWEGHVGRRADNVDAQDSAWAKSTEVMLNGALGFLDMWNGIRHLVDPTSDEHQMKVITQAYRDYLVDNRGGRPLLASEIYMLEREQNKDATANLLQGAKEYISRMFTDSERAIKGDPFGFIANMVMMSRAVVGGLSFGAAADAKLVPAASKFLARVDAALTGIPAAVTTAKVTAKMAGKGASAVWRPIRTLFTTPSRVEQIVRRAKEQGGAIGAGAQKALSSVDERIKGGASYKDAIKDAINEAPDAVGEFLSGAILEQAGIFHGATDVNLFLAELPNKKAVFTAWIDNDVPALIKELPDEVLETAGMKPAFAVDELIRTADSAKETILVDSTTVAKQMDDAMVQLGEEGRGAEVKKILAGVGEIQDRIRKGDRQYTHPLLRPDPETLPASEGVPIAFDANPGISNQSLLVALVREANGRPIYVTVNKAERSFFEGPLVGPKDILDAIPVDWKTRLPRYPRRSDARSPELVRDIIEEGGTSDLALYLQRSKNIHRGVEAQKAFEKLEVFFEKETGIPVSRLYGETRLGGITHNADTAMELVFRRTSRAPGAPTDIPGLYGIGRRKPYVGAGGKPLRPDIPPDRPFDVTSFATERMKKSTKAPPKKRAELAKMEQERIAAARALREGGLDAAEVFESARKASEEVHPQLLTIPEGLAGASPRYRNFDIDWTGRDLERAVYIAGSKQASKRKSAFRSLLNDRGITDFQIKRMRNEVLAGLKEQAKQGDVGTLSAPSIDLAKYDISLPKKKVVTRADADAIVRAVNDEPIFTPSQQGAMISQLKARSTKVSLERLGESLLDREVLVKIAQDRVIARRMKDEIRVGDDIANGGAWDDRTIPMVFTGTVESVAKKISEAHGARGKKYVRARELEPVSDISRKQMGLGDEGEFSVAGFVNDGFKHFDDLRRVSAAIDNASPLLRGILRSPQYVAQLFKRVLTSLNPPTGIFNATSNLAFRAFVDGNTGPGLAVVMSDLRKYAKDPSSLSPQKRALIEGAEEAGSLNANVVVDDINPSRMKLPVEVVDDFLSRISGVIPRITGVRLLKLTLKKIEELYGKTDPLFKMDHIYARATGTLENMGVLETGKSVWLNVDKNLWNRVVRGKDGKLHLGSVDGRVISKAELGRMVARDAAQSANRLYFDYSQVVRGYSMLRAAGIDGLLLNPFVTWAWKAMYLPMLKGGLAKEVMRGGRGLETDSPALLQKQTRSIMGRELTRFMVINSGLSAGRDEDMKLPDAVGAMLQYGPGPFFGSVEFGELDSWVTSRSGVNASSIQVEASRGLSSLFRDVPAEMNELSQPWEETESATEEILFKRIKRKAAAKIGPGTRGLIRAIESEYDLRDLERAQEIWDDMTEANPDGHKQFVYQVRSAHPMYDYNTMTTIGKLFQMKKPMYVAFAEFKGDERIKPENAYAGMVMTSLLGSKFLGRLGKDGLAVMRGDKDPDTIMRAFGKRKVPNSYWLKKANWLTGKQVKRYKTENEYNKEAGDTEERALEKRAWSLLTNIVARVDGNVMAIKLGDELRELGVDIFTGVESDLYDVYKTDKPVIPREIRQ